jgi:hypothetical protein
MLDAANDRGIEGISNWMTADGIIQSLTLY